MSTPIAIRQTRQAATKADPLGLSPRERAVAMSLYAGHGIRETSELLQCKYETVRSHLKAIRKKLGCRSVLGVVARLRLEEQTTRLSEPFAEEFDRAAHESDPRTLEYGGYEASHTGA